MKHTTKIISALLLAFAAILPTKAELRRAVTAGVAVSDLVFKQDLMTVKQQVGPQVGVMAELMFPGIGFGMDMGLHYSMLGAKMNLGERTIWAVDGYGNERLMLHSITLPVNLRFKWTQMSGLEEYFAPYVFGGPLVDFTVGHSRIKAMQYAAGAIGLQCGIGCELFKNFQIQASHVWGMTYITKAVKLTDFSARNRYWSIRACYFF